MAVAFPIQFLAAFQHTVPLGVRVAAEQRRPGEGLVETGVKAVAVAGVGALCWVLLDQILGS